jgi:hypothetical protein
VLEPALRDGVVRGRIHSRDDLPGSRDLLRSRCDADMCLSERDPTALERGDRPNSRPRGAVEPQQRRRKRVAIAIAIAVPPAAGGDHRDE